MNDTSVRSALGAAGLVAGPLAWATSTQLNYVLAAQVCQRATFAVALIAAALVVSALAGAVLSWRRLRGGRARPLDERGGRPHAFLAEISVGTGVLFSVVVLMQGVAGLMLSTCLR